MIICEFKDVRENLIKHIRKRSIIPIIGSGFSANSPAYDGRGQVPSGEKMKEDMIAAIKKQELDMEDSKHDRLKELPFSKLATYYHKLEPTKSKKEYIRNNFHRVELPEKRRKFLEIDWIYIYTLNFDDSIERCSEYENVILPNRDVDFSSLDGLKCLIKLHGDVNDYLPYSDCDSQIFDYKQYANSISSNRSLLDRLRNDFRNNNLLFVGCSLESEFDLSTISINEEGISDSLTSKYYFTVGEPDSLKKIDLEEYGITHVVLNESYDEIYSNIYSSYLLSKNIPLEDIDYYVNFSVKKLPVGYEENKEYLFHGKSVIDSENKTIMKPSFFISREMEDDLVRKISEKNSIHILFAPRVSGKTYALASIAAKIQDRDVYLFDSRNRVTRDVVLNNLMNKTRVILMFDTNSVCKDVIFDVIKKQDAVRSNQNGVIIAVNKSDKDVMSVVSRGIEDFDGFYYEISPGFTKSETCRLKSLMSKNELPGFYEGRSILDNLISIGKEGFYSNGRFSRIEPYMRSVEDLVFLILIAVKDKLYDEDLIRYDVCSVCVEQIKKTTPLIDTEHTLFFEKNISNSSRKKHVINAKYWLLEHLGKFAKEKENRNTIVEAYKSIVENTIKKKDSYTSYSEVMDYIKFDVINEIFKTDYKGQLGLAKSIYEKLQPLLSNNPHYYHQRAKCYLWQSGYKTSDLEDLRKALRFAKLSEHDFNVFLENRSNDKVEISLSHVKFTIALLAARISVISEFSDASIRDAIFSIYNAMKDPRSFDDYKRGNKKRRRDDIKSVVEKFHQLDTDKIDKDLLVKGEHVIEYLVRN